MHKGYKFSELFTVKLNLNHQVEELESGGLASGPSLAQIFIKLPFQLCKVGKTRGFDSSY